jgi:hypothetical protein
MAVNINGVQATVYTGADGNDGGLEESWPEGQPARAVIHWKCPWEQRFALIQGLRGGWFGWVLYLPHPYPYSPNLTCVGIGQIKGIKPRTVDGMLAYAEAIVPAEYGVPKFDFTPASPASPGADPSGKAYTRTSWNVSTEPYRPPGGTLYFEGGSLVAAAIPEESISLLRPRIEFTLTRYWLQSAPLYEVLSYAGDVNDETVTIGNLTFPRGTLWFAGAGGGSEQTESLDGRTGELTYTLIGNGPVMGSTGRIQPEWNHFLAPDGVWRYANTEVDGSGERPYRYSNWWDLLP